MTRERDDETPYERALERELTVYEDGAQAWQFQLLVAGAPLGVLLGAERATLFPDAPTESFRMGATLLVVALVAAAIGYMIVINAKSAFSARIARCMINSGAVTPEVARSVLRDKIRVLVPLAIASTIYFASLIASALMLLSSAGLLVQLRL